MKSKYNIIIKLNVTNTIILSLIVYTEAPEKYEDAIVKAGGNITEQVKDVKSSTLSIRYLYKYTIYIYIYTII